MKTIKIILLMSVVLLYSCSDNFPIIEDFGKTNYELVNQDSIKFNFPKDLQGKVILVGYIFTNCPDICPLTTNNMRLIQEQLKAEGVTDVEFLSLSFDPLQDKPSVLKKFAEIRNLDLSNWTFVTGEEQLIKRLVKRAEVFAIQSDSIMFDDGDKIYLYVHTDRISLIDRQGRIRKNYLGSTAPVEEIINDTKLLIEE